MLRHALTALVVFNLIFLNTPVQCVEEYYWRDWNGTAPSDGFVAGTNQNQKIYIAQAFILNSGLYVGYVVDGQTNVLLNFGSENIQQSTALKVLCAQPEDLYWMPVDSASINTILEYYLAMVGGVNNGEDNREVIHIGRTNSAQNAFIGGIYRNDLKLYYYDGSLGSNIDEFEILLRNV